MEAPDIVEGAGANWAIVPRETCVSLGQYQLGGTESSRKLHLNSGTAPRAIRCNLGSKTAELLIDQIYGLPKDGRAIGVNKTSFGRVRTNAFGLSAPERRVRRTLLSADARRARRNRMILPGKLCSKTSTKVVDCLIGDMSTSGARVRVKAGTATFDNLYLVHLREWIAYEAQVVWRRADGNLGLQFKRSYDLEGAIKPELRVLRELCIQNRRLS
jgi:hypothetical protein